MAHSLNRDPAPAPSPAPARPNRPALDSDEVMQARADLAACFRFADRLNLAVAIP